MDAKDIPTRRFDPGPKEPLLEEILADPVVRTLMARDGVGIGDIRYLADLVRGAGARAADGDQAPKPFSITAASRLENACGSATGSPSTIRA